MVECAPLPSMCLSDRESGGEHLNREILMIGRLSHVYAVPRRRNRTSAKLRVVSLAFNITRTPLQNKHMPQAVPPRKEN